MRASAAALRRPDDPPVAQAPQSGADLADYITDRASVRRVVAALRESRSKDPDQWCDFHAYGGFRQLAVMLRVPYLLIVLVESELIEGGITLRDFADWQGWEGKAHCGNLNDLEYWKEKERREAPSTDEELTPIIRAVLGWLLGFPRLLRCLRRAYAGRPDIVDRLVRFTEKVA